MANIWNQILDIERSSIKSYGLRGSSCTIDETNQESAKLEINVLNQYKALAPEIEKLVTNSSDYEPNSIEHLDDDSFAWFNKSGEYCMYSPRIRADMRNIDIEYADNNSKNSINFNKGPITNYGVSVIGPWYSRDKSFTDQYKNEAEKLASFLSCDYKIYSNGEVCIDSIVNALENSDIVIFDSHGVSANNTSYICLTTSFGITQDDYRSKHAVNGGNWFGVDGTAIVNHSKNTFKCKLLWMAMCEGMKRSGQGGMAIPLNKNGVKSIYGYSQSVSFYGDYLYEESFFNSLRLGKSISECFNIMTEKYGEKDPAYTNTQSAYPIIVSDEDPFPNNTDEHQIVKSNLRFGEHTIKDAFSHGLKILYKSTTKAGKSSFNIVYNNNNIGFLYINKEFNDKSLDNTSGIIHIE